MKEIIRVDRRQASQDVADRILMEKDYGELLTFEYLQQLTGYERYDIDFIITLAIVKEILIEYGYVLKSILNKGYKILYPNEIAEEVIQKYLKSSTNKLAKGLKIMQYTDKSLLTSSEKKNFEHFESVINGVYENNEDSLLSAQAVLNDIKQKEIEV